MQTATGALKLPNPWEVVGRGTETGRALFALYNGFGVARNLGNEYSNRNRQKIRRSLHRAMSELARRESGSKESSEPKSKKPTVKVPHFHKKPSNFADFPKVLLMRGRRKASSIMMKTNEEHATWELPPVPKRSVLDEKEKKRLQYLFEWSGRNVGPDPPVHSEPIKNPVKGSIEEQELLLGAIAKEIDERHEFIEEMRRFGRRNSYEEQMQAEILDRIKQMKLLNENISQMAEEHLRDSNSDPRRSPDGSIEKEREKETKSERGT